MVQKIKRLTLSRKKATTMTHKEISEFIEISSEEVLALLASIEGLLILAGHYQNHPETNSCLSLIEKCTFKLEDCIEKAKNRNKNG